MVLILLKFPWLSMLIFPFSFHLTFASAFAQPISHWTNIIQLVLHWRKQTTQHDENTVNNNSTVMNSQQTDYSNTGAGHGIRTVCHKKFPSPFSKWLLKGAGNCKLQLSKGGKLCFGRSPKTVAYTGIMNEYMLGPTNSLHNMVLSLYSRAVCTIKMKSAQAQSIFPVCKI